MYFFFKALYKFLHGKKMSLGCDVGMEMMEEEFEDCKRTSKPFRKLSCSPNHLFEIHF